MTNFNLSKEQILGLLALGGAALAGAAGFFAGKNQKRPWNKTDHATAYLEGYADGMQGRQRHEYAMKELENRPKVVEKVVKVPVPEETTPYVAIAKGVEAFAKLTGRDNGEDENDENEEDE